MKKIFLFCILSLFLVAPLQAQKPKKLKILGNGDEILDPFVISPAPAPPASADTEKPSRGHRFFGSPVLSLKITPESLRIEHPVVLPNDLVGKQGTGKRRFP